MLQGMKAEEGSEANGRKLEIAVNERIGRENASDNEKWP